MARPKKQTVDYFPHDANHKTTLFVLLQRYGNDGYSFWFMLLEELCRTEGHFYDCNNLAKWEFLQAKTRLSGDKCIEILNLLSDLDAIDRELWIEKVIWSDNFISRIADAYKNRRADVPQKPSFYRSKLSCDVVSTGHNPAERDKSIVSTGRNPHIKRNETKVNETKDITISEKKSKLSPPPSLKDFLTALKSNPAYKGIDIDRELHMMDAWLLTPKGKGRKKTHAFILNWLNKAEKVLPPQEEEENIATHMRKLKKEYEEQAENE